MGRSFYPTFIAQFLSSHFFTFEITVASRFRWLSHVAVLDFIGFMQISNLGNCRVEEANADVEG